MATHTDGFITEFCNELTIGIGEPLISQREGVRAGWNPSGELTLFGLNDGPHDLQVYDAQGRLVLQQNVRSMARRCEPVPLGSAGSAVYMMIVDHARTGRLVTTH